MSKKCNCKALFFNTLINEFQCQICKKIVKNPKTLSSMGGSLKSPKKEIKKKASNKDRKKE
jgi:hypothetical protein